MEPQRKILAYHRQFDSLRVDGLASLYSIVDYLRPQLNRGVIQFVFDSFAGEWAPYFIEESQEYQQRQQVCRIPWLQGRRLIAEMESRICMVADMGDGRVYRFGFPKRLNGKLWFPVISYRPIGSDFYTQIRALDRPVR